MTPDQHFSLNFCAAGVPDESSNVLAVTGMPWMIINRSALPFGFWRWSAHHLEMVFLRLQQSFNATSDRMPEAQKEIAFRFTIRLLVRSIGTRLRHLTPKARELRDCPLTIFVN